MTFIETSFITDKMRSKPKFLVSVEQEYSFHLIQIISLSQKQRLPTDNLSTWVVHFCKEKLSSRKVRLPDPKSTSGAPYYLARIFPQCRNFLHFKILNETIFRIFTISTKKSISLLHSLILRTFICLHLMVKSFQSSTFHESLCFLKFNFFARFARCSYVFHMT